MAMASKKTLKPKCCHFDELFVTGCAGSCHFDNFQCSQWRKFRQNNDISVSANNRQLDRLFNSWFKLTSNKITKIRITGISEGTPPATVNSPHKRPVMWKMSSCNGIIMQHACTQAIRQLAQTSYLWRPYNTTSHFTSQAPESRGKNF